MGLPRHPSYVRGGERKVWGRMGKSKYRRGQGKARDSEGGEGVAFHLTTSPAATNDVANSGGDDDDDDTVRRSLQDC